MGMTPGQLLREVRQRRGLTLNQVAEAAGVTGSFVSQFERSLTQASVATLQKLADAVGIQVSAFFDSEVVPTPRVLRKATRPTRAFGRGGTKELITLSPFVDLEAFSLTLEPGGASSDEPESHGSSDELIIVESGEVRLELGDDTHVLEPGDSIYFSSKVPHRLINSSPSVCSVLWIITPPSGSHAPSQDGTKGIGNAV